MNFYQSVTSQLKRHPDNYFANAMPKYKFGRLFYDTTKSKRVRDDKTYAQYHRKRLSEKSLPNYRGNFTTRSTAIAAIQLQPVWMHTHLLMSKSTLNMTRKAAGAFWTRFRCAFQPKAWVLIVIESTTNTARAPLAKTRNSGLRRSACRIVADPKIRSQWHQNRAFSPLVLFHGILILQIWRQSLESLIFHGPWNFFCHFALWLCSMLLSFSNQAWENSLFWSRSQEFLEHFWHMTNRVIRMA